MQKRRTPQKIKADKNNILIIGMITIVAIIGIITIGINANKTRYLFLPADSSVPPVEILSVPYFADDLTGYAVLIPANTTNATSTMPSSPCATRYQNLAVTYRNLAATYTDYARRYPQNAATYLRNAQTYTQRAELFERAYQVCLTSPQSLCSDSDSGINLYVLGTATINSRPFADSCSNSNTIIDYYCDSNDPFATPKAYSASCYYGCSNGVCNRVATTTTTIPTTPDSCSDTDGGNNPFTRGSVTGYLSGRRIYNTDYCSSTGVYEYYCSGTRSYGTYINCVNGCLNGACKPLCTGTSDWFNPGLITCGTTTYKNTCLSSTRIRYYINYNGKLQQGEGACFNSACVTKNGWSYCESQPLPPAPPTMPSDAETCKDETDRGANIYTKGSVTTSKGVLTDECIDANRLHERVCYVGTLGTIFSDVRCTYGCSDGACKLPT